MRPAEDPNRCDQVTLGCHQEYAHLEVRKRLLLRMNCRLILLKIVIPAEPVVDKIRGVDFLGNLKLSLIENLFEHSPGYSLFFAACAAASGKTGPLSAANAAPTATSVVNSNTNFRPMIVLRISSCDHGPVKR